jgi:SAM-dependent methyltransferase
MDLLETHGGPRHPWELSRARSVAHIAQRYAPSPVRSILDYGCGDGFTGKFLTERLGADQLVGFDVHLDEERCRQFGAGDPRVLLLCEEKSLPDRRFDLVLMCDVIEHVADDRGLVERVTRNFLSPDGRLVVTVPAFQKLFSSHDKKLRHFRRYNLSQLESVLVEAGLELIGSGYLFGSLLPVRALVRLVEAVRPPAIVDQEIGLAGSKPAKLVSLLGEVLFGADNTIMLGLAAVGLKTPGLSVWACCRRPE